VRGGLEIQISSHNASLITALRLVYLIMQEQFSADFGRYEDGNELFFDEFARYGTQGWVGTYKSVSSFLSVTFTFFSV